MRNVRDTNGRLIEATLETDTPSSGVGCSDMGGMMSPSVSLSPKWNQGSRIP